MQLEDSQSQLRPATQLLVPAACWRAGARVWVSVALSSLSIEPPIH